MTRRAFQLLFPIIASLVAVRASAVSVETNLKPGHLSDNSRMEFTIRHDEGDRLTSFQFIVKWKAGAKPSPFLEATLQVVDADGTDIVVCPVHSEKSDDELVYRFSISAKFLQRAKFRFAELGYVTRKDERGSEKFEPMPSADFFLVNLIDFAKKESASP